MKYLLLGSLAIAGLSFATAEETVAFQPGCLAKLYVCGKFPVEKTDFTLPVPEWPIKTLPDSPVEIQKLRELPEVKPTTLDDIWKNKTQPNTLISSKFGALNGINFYAVEFEGYYFSPIEGIYTIAVTSDDPVTIYCEGKTILESTFSANPNIGPSYNGNNDGIWPGPVEKCPLTGDVQTTQASIKLSPNKYYHLVVAAAQRWFPCPQEYFNHPGNVVTRALNRGAMLKTFLTTPDQKTGPLILQLPVIK